MVIHARRLISGSAFWSIEENYDITSPYLGVIWRISIPSPGLLSTPIPLTAPSSPPPSPPPPRTTSPSSPHPPAVPRLAHTPTSSSPSQYHNTASYCCT